MIFFVFQKLKRYYLFVANVKSLVVIKKLAQSRADKAMSMVKGVLDYSELKDMDMVIEVCSFVRDFPILLCLYFMIKLSKYYIEIEK